MLKQMYDYNILVSYWWSHHGKAKREIVGIIQTLGDEVPVVERTIAQGIIGLKTCLDSREIILELRRLFYENPFVFQFTLKWVPIDLWTLSDMESMKEGVVRIRNMIQTGEKWRMTVEKRRYTQHQKTEIIRELANLIEEKVDLENPEKILRLDIIGNQAGIAILKPQEIFSVKKSYFEIP